MQIIVASTSGFCFGVDRAVKTADQLIEEKTDDSSLLYMLGPVIHNMQVVHELEKKGMIMAESVADIPPGATVLIRAHGVTPQTLAELRAKNCRVVDRTCPYVGKIHNIVRQAAAKGKQVIIAGAANHPEVIGISGECGSDCLVVETVEQAKSTHFSDENHVFVAQTTFSVDEYRKIRNVLQKKIAKLEIFDTICITTVSRQQEAYTIAGEVDMMFVLGSTSSSNTRKLLEICHSRCGQTHLIEHPDQVRPIMDMHFTDGMTIGVTAGASTPERIIREVIHAMTENEQLQNQQEDLQKKQENLQNELETQQEKSENQPEEPQVETENQPETEQAVETKASETAAEAQPQVVETEQPQQAAEPETEAEPAADEQPEIAVEAEKEAEAEVTKETEAEVEKDTEAEVEKEAESSEQEEKHESADVSFSDFIDNIPQLKRGATVKGVIVRYDSENVYVDVRDKSEGRIPRHEFDNDPDFDLDKAIAEHTEIDVYVRNIRNSDLGKEIVLSKARVDFGKYKALIEEAYNDKTPISVKIVNVVKDGVIASYGGVDIYVHRTQLEMGIVEDLEPYRGQTLDILVTQYDPDKKRLRVSGSRRALLANERRKKAEQLWETIEVGDKYKGIVRSLTDFGAFVDIGGVDGLVHVSELSWQRIRHPSEIVNVGDEVEVHVKDFDKERKRISLGYKKAEDDPYHDIESRFPVGSIVRGIVVRMFPFGAFVEIAPGVDALCHISQIANVRLSKPNDVLSEGMEIDARVLEVSNEARRISISIKEVEPINPEGYEEELAESGAGGFDNQAELDKF